MNKADDSPMPSLVTPRQSQLVALANQNKVLFDWPSVATFVLHTSWLNPGVLVRTLGE